MDVDFLLDLNTEQALQCNRLIPLCNRLSIEKSSAVFYETGDRLGISPPNGRM
jgi:hypothetical protein